MISLKFPLVNLEKENSTFSWNKWIMNKHNEETSSALMWAFYATVLLHYLLLLKRREISKTISM